MPRRGAKITVVGVGAVGACVAYTLATGGPATELALIDADHRRAVFTAGAPRAPG